MRIVNDPRPWWGMLPGPPLSIVDLIGNGTITAETAAALWWALRRGASVFVVAGPRLAGKTTLATALLPFLPADARAYVTAGPGDALAVPPGDGPLYLLINELSNHTPMYLAGPAARRAFALLRDGAHVVGTLHADSAAEAVAVMRREVEIPASDIARVTLVVVLRVRRTDAGAVERRVVEVGLLVPEGEDVGVAPVAAWDADRDAATLLPPPGGTAALARWAGVATAAVEEAVAAGARILTDLLRRGSGADEVAAAVARHDLGERAGHAPA
jgi:hypothetical protein